MTDLAAAQDPTTPPDRLRDLAGPGHPPAVGAAVAGNPNTDAATLVDLMRRFPAEVVGNLALELLLFADPGLLAAHREFRLLLAGHPGTPGWLFERLLGSADQGVLLALASNPALPGPLIDRILASEDTRRWLAEQGAVSGTTLIRRLRSDASPRIRALVAERALKPLRGWGRLLGRAEQLARGRGDPARGPLSGNEQRALLAGGVWARVLLARQPRIVAGVARELVADRAPQVRRAVAAAAWIDDAAILELMDEEDEGTSLRLAARPRLTEGLGRALARSGFFAVRRRLAARPDLPAAVLALLGQEPALALELQARGAATRRG